VSGQLHLPGFVHRHPKLLTWIAVSIAAVAGLLFIAQDTTTLHVASAVGADDPRFPTYLARHLNAPLLQGTAFTPLQDGDEIFPAMLDAIRRARTRIDFESYIFSGAPAETFTQALCDAARRGVEVRLVLDALGVPSPPHDLEARIKASGGDVEWFNGVGPWTIEKANYRTHRKLLVVDGTVAFTGGAGVADHWVGRVEDGNHWRDTQFRVTGPGAAALEAAFFENWMQAGGAADPYFDPPEPAHAGAAPAIVVWSDATEGPGDVKLMYLYAIAAARHTIDLQSPYFVLDSTTRRLFAAARARGVHIRVLTDGDKTDVHSVREASRNEYAALLRAGDEIYEYQPTMMHAKVMIVDRRISIFGTANFDNRSLELNDELSIASADPDLAATLTRAFEHDVKRSKAWTPEEWRRRPITEKVRERFWGLFAELF
jgi:cardiolipin synthase